MIQKIVMSILITTVLGSCATVREYEKVELNDPDMSLSAGKLDRFQTNFQAYREAAAGANGGKTGGGCGCN